MKREAVIRRAMLGIEGACGGTRWSQQRALTQLQLRAAQCEFGSAAWAGRWKGGAGMILLGSLWHAHSPFAATGHTCYIC